MYTTGRVSRHDAAYPAECLVYGDGGGGDDVTTPATNFDITDISVHDTFSAWDLPREGQMMFLGVPTTPTASVARFRY